MPKKENANHKQFIRYRISGLSRTDAYMKAYNITDEDPKELKRKRRLAQINACHLVTTNNNIRKAIDQAIEESRVEAERTLALDLASAADTITEIREKGTVEDNTRLKAATYEIDRAMGKPRTDVNIDGTITGDITVVTAIQRPKDWKDGD